MTIPSPRDWVAGEKITQTRLLTGVRDPLDFLLDPPRCRVFNAGGQSFANGTNVLCLWTDEVYDPQSMHSTSTNPSRINIPEDGLYDVKLYVAFTSGTFTSIVVNPRINADGNPANGTSIRTETFDAGSVTKFPFDQRFAAGDRLEVWAQQSSGATRTASTASLGFGISVRWVAI